jgi:hypothetical protein
MPCSTVKNPSLFTLDPRGLNSATPPPDDAPGFKLIFGSHPRSGRTFTGVKLDDRFHPCGRANFGDSAPPALPPWSDMPSKLLYSYMDAAWLDFGLK